MKRFHWEQDQIAHMKVPAWLHEHPPTLLLGIPAPPQPYHCGFWLTLFLQNYIARFGHGSAKLARQAQSKEKTLQKMMASGLTERVVNDKVGSDMGLRLGICI